MQDIDLKKDSRRRSEEKHLMKMKKARDKKKDNSIERKKEGKRIYTDCICIVYIIHSYIYLCVSADLHIICKLSVFSQLFSVMDPSHAYSEIQYKYSNNT